MKACVFTLGCKQNEAESASLMRGLETLGYETTDALEYADLYLLNTCAVTAEAERKSRQAVARMRKFNPNAKILVFGCAAQNAPEDFLRKEGVSLVAGAMRKDKILGLLEAEGTFCEAETDFCELPAPKRNKTRACLRVQDGCNRFCTYCLIPYLRGRSRSRGLKSVVEEANACGAKEIVLTGIDLSSYRDGENDLGDLLLALKDVPARIRLGSLEEGIVTEEFLNKMRAAGNVLPHFHLSLQSGSDSVLRAMNRRYTRDEYLRTCRRVYDAFPDAAITTDIIVGFPTETEEDFLSSVGIVKEARFAHVHAFPFSARKGTAAARLPDLPAVIKKERTARMLQVCADAEDAYISRFLGRKLTALFEDDGGYTENYIRVFAAGAVPEKLYEVLLTERIPGGARAQIVREI